MLQGQRATPDLIGRDHLLMFWPPGAGQHPTFICAQPKARYLNSGMTLLQNILRDRFCAAWLRPMEA